VRPLPYAEAGFGYPEDGQTIVNITNGKVVRLLVDDEPFDVRYGDLLEHESGPRPARRNAEPAGEVALPAGKQVVVTSTRLVSLTQRSVAAIEYTVEAVDEFALITVQRVGGQRRPTGRLPDRGYRRC
jgi:trehalose/maltose hydrolase-like predicted phosphorylase